MTLSSDLIANPLGVNILDIFQKKSQIGLFTSDIVSNEYGEPIFEEKSDNKDKKTRKKTWR